MARGEFTDEAREKARAARKAIQAGTVEPVVPTGKMAAYAETFEKQRREFPKMALPLINQVAKGSKTAAIKLKCLECSCWVRQEVRDCVIASCPLYPIRPYQELRGRNPNDADLTLEKVEQVKRLYRSGEKTVPQLTEMFCISRLAVLDILSGTDNPQYTVLPKERTRRKKGAADMVDAENDPEAA